MANSKLAKEYLNSIAEGAPSFFAFLLSIFIYDSIFNLSDLSALFNDTKFWFCISNSLIFIIASDCGAFSPPPPEQKSKQLQNRAVKIARERPKDYREATIIPAKNYRRSKSEKAVEKERKIAMRRSKTMVIKLQEEEASTEENGSEEMTDEELNRRVEEFIERFNRRIRLQDLEYGDGA